MKMEMHDLKALEVLRRFYAAVSDSDFIAFSSQLILAAFPCYWNDCRASCVSTAVTLGVADGDNVALWQELTTAGSGRCGLFHLGEEKGGRPGPTVPAACSVGNVRILFLQRPAARLWGFGKASTNIKSMELSPYNSS